MHESGEAPDVLISRAQAGDREALGRLLQLYRNYLWMLARSQLGGALRKDLNPSDLVQEVSLEACRDFNGFRGGTEPELVAWLRRIFVRNLADQARRTQAAKRDRGREESLEALLDRSSIAVHEALARGISTPSAGFERRESAVLLSDAIAGLPEDYRDVIILRHIDRLKFEDVAAKLGRTPGAVRMLWARALEKLRGALEEAP